MNDLTEKYLEEYLWLAAKLEEYVVHGVFRDMMNYRITDKDGEKIFRLGRFQTDIPGLFNRWLRPENEVTDMALNKVILFKNVDQTIPLDVLEEACKTYNKYASRCVVMDGEILVQKDVTTPKAKVLAEECENFKEFYEIIVLGNESLEEDNVQPFPVVMDGNKVKVMGFLQGDVDLIPNVVKKVRNIHQIADSFDEFWKDIGNSAAVIKGLLGEESCLLLFTPLANSENPNDAGILEFPEDFAKEHPWGASYSTREPSTGGEHVEVKETPPADGAKKGFQRMTGGTAEPVRVAAEGTSAPKAYFIFGSGQHPAGTPVVKVKKNEVSKVKPELRSRVGDSGALKFNDKEAWAYLAPGFHKDEAHRIYEEYLGFIPDNWKQEGKGPLFPVSFLVKAYNVGSLQSSASPLVTGKSQEIAQPSQKIDDASLRDLQEDLTKIAGTTSQNPDQMFQEDEKFTTSFLEKLGKDISWPGIAWVGRVLIAKGNPENAARIWGLFQVICNNLRHRVKELEDRVHELEADLEKATAKAPPKKAFGSMK